MTGLVNFVPWIAVEGTNATGKTYLVRQAIDALGPRCLPLTELPDTPAALLPGRIIEALHTSGDPFLRTGVPRTETLLLAALQVHRHETALPRPGQIVLEDRGPHSVAVYQAVILCGGDANDDELLCTARTILELIMRWRPLPPRVLLLVDDPGTCLARFEQRAGRAARADEELLMRRVGCLYELLADLDPARFQVLDRRLLTEQQCVAAILDACHAAVLGGQQKG
ncbi:MAG: hypothetical protein ACRDTA_04500 [Pseudonocardiaceae bacterium]